MAGKDVENKLAAAAAITAAAAGVAVGVDKLVKIVTGEPVSFWFKKATTRKAKTNPQTPDKKP